MIERGTKSKIPRVEGNSEFRKKSCADFAIIAIIFHFKYGLI